jgi:phosphoglycolate phosphatase
VILVGDTRHDYEVAQALGIGCVLVEGGHQSRERLVTCPVPLLASIRAVPGHLALARVRGEAGQSGGP